MGMKWTSVERLTVGFGEEYEEEGLCVMIKENTVRKKGRKEKKKDWIDIGVGLEVSGKVELFEYKIHHTR